MHINTCNFSTKHPFSKYRSLHTQVHPYVNILNTQYANVLCKPIKKNSKSSCFETTRGKKTKIISKNNKMQRTHNNVKEGI